MAMFLGALYDALRTEHPTEQQARAAAEEVASYEARMQAVERDLAVLKYASGVVVALLLAVVGMVWATRNNVNALAATIAGVQADLRNIRGELSDVKTDVKTGIAAIRDDLARPK